MKGAIKRIIPSGLLKLVLPLFHWLQAWAANTRYGWPARGLSVIAVTGTNGKTTTAAFIGKILERNGFKVGINSTAFYQIGTEVEMNETNMTVTDPFRLFRLLKRMKDAQVDWVILEVTSHALSQSRTLGIPVEVAAMTNLTQDHLDYHHSMDEYAAAKGKLFNKRARLHVLNRDDEWFEFFNRFQPRERTLTYGTDADADCRILKAQIGPHGSHLELKLERSHISPHVKLVGKFNAYNALCAASIAHGLGIDSKIIREGLEALEHVPGRMETIEAGQGFKVVIDYAHTADALQNVLESLRGITQKRLITVFGATGDRDKTKRPIMGKVVARLSDIAIVTDDDPYTENPITIRAEVLGGVEDVVDGAQVREIADRRAAIAKAIELAKKGDIVLLAGIGHQKYRVIDGQKVEWSERAVVEGLLGQ